MTEDEVKKIEEQEYKFLDTIKSCLNLNKEKIASSLETINTHKQYWERHVTDKNFLDTGVERIIYSTINNNVGDLGGINCNPIGSDLMFENENAVIHIDCKVANNSNNKGDATNSIPIGENQFSYNTITNIKNKFKERRRVIPNLPVRYGDKLCLTYIISLMYENNQNNITWLDKKIVCIPNGLLNEYYSKNLKDKKNNQLHVLNAIKPGGNPILKVEYNDEIFKYTKEDKITDIEGVAKETGLDIKLLSKDGIFIRQNNGARFNYRNCRFITLDKDRYIKLV